MEVLGLKAHRYYMANETYEIQPEYYQFIQGFVNITAIQQAPIFLSNPHMAGAEEKWRNAIIGMKPVDFNRDYTTVDIEPNLGKVIQVYKNLQVNAYVEEGTNKFVFYNPGFKTGVMYPITWAYEVEVISQPLADQIKNQLYSIITFESVVIPIFVPVGLFLMFIGFFVMVILGLCKYRLTKEAPHDYAIINDS